MRPLIIYGIGPFARLMHYHWTQLRSNGSLDDAAPASHQVVAFTVDRDYLIDETFCDLPVWPFEELASRAPPQDFDLFVAIGYRRMRQRQLLFERAQAAGYAMPNFVGPRSIVADNVRHGRNKIGQNNIILDGAQIEPFVELGDNNVVWSGSLVCHDSRIRSHNFLGPRACLAGNTVLGDLCFLGAGATLIDNLTIADETHLVAGSVLFQSTEPGTRYRGNPARPSGNHSERGIEISRSASNRSA